MSTKPKFDPSRVANLLKIGTAEARSDVRSLSSVPSSNAAGAVQVDTPPAASVAEIPRAPVSEEVSSDQDQVVRIEKRAITVRLSDEVLSALYRHQAEMRCLPGARLKDTTIGGVIDTLLRISLKLS